jgi:hypothetical protein
MQTEGTGEKTPGEKGIAELMTELVDRLVEKSHISEPVPASCYCAHNGLFSGLEIME